MSAEPDVRVKLAVYRHFAETGRRPEPEEVARRARLDSARVLAAYQSLREEIAPFSGVPTQHRVEVGGTTYFANCAWDALGVPAALHQPGRVHSRCEASGEPLDLEVGIDGPEPSEWVFHCLVPASHWWDDLVFT